MLVLNVNDWRDLQLLVGGGIENGDVNLDASCFRSKAIAVFAYFVTDKVD